MRPLVVVAPAVIAAVIGSTSACGNAITTEINGMSGVTVDAAGRPMLVAVVCTGAVAGVTVAGPNRGTLANEVRAELTTAPPTQESFVLDLVSPGESWAGRALALPLRSDVHIAYAHGGAEADSQLAQVTFTSAELAELRPGTVQFGSHEPGEPAERTTSESFAGIACAD